jgi:NAD(P)-dependent dehydrogenase (short-subunit alcohol dehydrogenase family)
MRLGYKVAGGLAAGAALGGVAAGIGTLLVARELYRRMRSADLHGNVVLITGSSRGLGLAMAEEFARQGANLVICARDENELSLAEERLRALGAEVLSVACDIGQREQVQDLVRRANQRFGGVDVLVNNAGIITVGPLKTQTLEDFQRSMDVIFWGTVYPTLEVLPQMLARRSGRIANITSIGGRISVPHLLPYNCAKFATVGFSEGLRAELAKDKIKVTTVIPGLMRTGSYINAEMKGQQRAEYAWFSLSSSLPLLTAGARRAARCIVSAVRRGDAEIIITPGAKLASLAHGIAPGLTADVLGLVNRVLPTEGDASTERLRGKEAESAVSRSFVTALGKKAAREFQHEEPTRTVAKPAATTTGSTPAEAIGT